MRTPLNRLTIKALTIGLLIAPAMVPPAHAAHVTITLHKVTKEGVGSEIGRVRLEDSTYGLLIKPDLKGVAPGPHDFDVHENPDCGPVSKNGETIPGGAAGGHYDPKNIGHPDGPYGKGALGDLPNLIAEQDGSVTIPTLAPRLKVRDVRGRSLVVHAGADRYGQGHASHHHGHARAHRVACGIIP